MNFCLMSILTLSLFTIFTACKKETDPKPDSSEEVKTHSDDQNYVSGEMDAIASEINVALESDPNFSGRMQSNMEMANMCGASAVADLQSNPRKITITYDGNNCFGTHQRSGVVVISMPAGVHWKTAGAALTVSFQNVKIKRLVDNKSITINGSQTFTNVSGGLVVTLANGGSITHTIGGEISVKFDDNTQRNWNVARKRVITKSNNKFVLTISGNHTSGNNNGIAEWGTNRFGHAFTTSITQPLVFREDCLGRLTAGEIKHEGFATATVTFGLNATGEPTTCPLGATYFYKVSWTGPAGNTHSVVLPY